VAGLRQRQRKPPDIEDQHVEAAGALAVSTALHGLRSAPDDAQTLVTTTMLAFTRLLDQQPLFSRTLGLV
jgi:hypothetical protein